MDIKFSDANMTLFAVFTGEILDIPDANLTKQVFLKHRKNDHLRVEASQTQVTRKVYGSVRRSRKTPPLKHRRSSGIGEL